jgi:hypothetical protein
MGEFPAVAAFFDAAKGQPGIGTNKGINKTAAGL